jgi:L-amino acid N-acyltransferase YncA
MTTIRPAIDSDLSAIAEIYAHHVLHGTGTFETSPPDMAEMVMRRADVLSKNLPYLVAVEKDIVIGFAYCNWFKPRPAYRFSAEDSVYLTPSAAGRGVGKLLLTELIAQAERSGVRKLIAVIGDSQNASSIALHRACGFQAVGVLTACGWKFERWLDVVLMERSVGMGISNTPG